MPLKYLSFENIMEYGAFALLEKSHLDKDIIKLK